MITHLSGEPKYCPLCHYLPGTGEKTYKCNKCDKPFFCCEMCFLCAARVSYSTSLVIPFSLFFPLTGLHWN